MSVGQLVLAGTPLGNTADATARLVTLIEDADVIAAEDTRRFKRLARDLGVTFSAKVISYYDAVEREKSDSLAELAAEGALVLIVSDAGMPTVSDPGYRLVVACRERGVPVSVAPGPSAVTAALAVSGLPSDRFCFEGFLPRKGSHRNKRLRELSNESRTMVFFESPHRVSETLAELAGVLGPERPACMCRELTKTYEEIKPGTLTELAEATAEGVKGEVTLVIGGRPAADAPSIEELVEEVVRRVSAGANRKDVVAEIALDTGVSRRELYNAVLSAKSNP